MVKSENIEEVGVHVFERAGLGQAPFYFVGMHERTYQACSDAPVQAAGTCDFCGNCIRYCCEIRSADRRHFVVGTDCVNKTGDSGIIRAFKQSKEWRKHQMELRQKADNKRRDALHAAMADEAMQVKLAAMPHPNGFKDRATGEPLTALDFVKWMMMNSGAAGRARLAKWIKSV